MLRSFAAALTLVGVVSMNHVGKADARPAKTLRGYHAALTSRSCLSAQTTSILNALEARIGRVTIVSTCRPGAVIAGSRGRPSFHRYGMAVDFHTARKAEAISFLQTQPVLVMTYCAMSHVHFNTGQKATIGCNRRSHMSAARKRRR